MSSAFNLWPGLTCGCACPSDLLGLGLGWGLYIWSGACFNFGLSLGLACCRMADLAVRTFTCTSEMDRNHIGSRFQCTCWTMRSCSMFQLFHVRPNFQNSITPGSTEDVKNTAIKLRLDDWIFWLRSWEV